MKHYNKILMAIAALFMISCAEEFGSRDIGVEEPGYIKEYAYLDDYDVLKNYVNREANPNFKLGTGVDVTAFLNQGSAYSASVSNFDELTATDAMVYGKVVDNKGTMNTVNVMKFTRLAKEAGASIYGHTLVWHAQQQPRYLKSLVMLSMEPEVSEQNFETDDASNWKTQGAPANGVTVTTGYTAAGEGYDGKGRALTVTNDKVGVNDYDAQFFFVINPTATPGKEYKFSMDIKSDAPNASIATQQHKTPGAYVHWAAVGTISSTTTWQHYTWTGKFDNADIGAIAFNLGTVATTYYIDNVKWEEYVAPVLTEKIVNGGFETDDETNFQVNGADAQWAFTADGEGVTGRAVKVTNPSDHTNAYEVQFFPKWAPPMEAGEYYDFSISIRADAPATISTQAHSSPGNYLGMMKSLNITTEWKTFTAADIFSNGNVYAGMGAIAFDLGKSITTFYFDNMSLVKTESGATEQQRPEAEQVANLTAELDRWIGGLMKATEGYVTAWDVVNEPMDDANPTELRTAPETPGDNDFYWQDYLGKDYARVAVKIAREKYAEQENSSPLKLFVNDYGLEVGDNAKAKGLIDMINYWESDGVTKIDGIGAQLHVSYSLDAATQSAQEAGIENMFKLLAATGKLIKISELDMVIKTAAGEDIPAGDLTFEQQQLMANFYKFIIQKYLELVPVSQQYGITQWSATDASNLPLGLWDSAYKRKPTYAGFAEGLGGKPIPEAPAAE
jgi:GH35 family endo-1,4-beta-xylanase